MIKSCSKKKKKRLLLSTKKATENEKLYGNLEFLEVNLVTSLKSLKREKSVKIANSSLLMGVCVEERSVMHWVNTCILYLNRRLISQ